MKTLLKKILFNRVLGNFLLDFTLKLHNRCYFLASSLSIALSKNSEHPKHYILGYKEWFLDRISTEDIVLDIGCNTGKMVNLFAAKASFSYGIDIVKKHVEEASSNNKNSNVEFFCFDATKFDYSKLNPVTVITLSNVLEHIENRVGFLKSLLDQIGRDNKQKIKVLIRVPSIEREWITVFKKDRGLNYFLDETHFIEYTKNVLRDELSSAGLQIRDFSCRFGEYFVVCAYN